MAELLDAERLGIEVSEETGFQYQPEQTTSAHHLPPPASQVLRRSLTSDEPGLPLQAAHPGS